jgi:molybdopterin/thiamine biosynthesis adenylyltransferase
LFPTDADPKSATLPRRFTDVTGPRRARSFPVPPRAARIPAFVGCDPEQVRAVLDQLRVTLVGVGAVGRVIAIHLARLQIAALQLVDRARYKPESLLTQAITPEEVGESKAQSTGELTKRISPATRVEVFDGPFEALAPTELARTDLLILATDNLSTEVRVGQRCIELRKPLVHGSVHGETLIAHARFLSNASPDTPCPACGFTADEWAHLNASTRFSCEGTDPVNAPARATTRPTRSVSWLCSTAADLVLMQVLRHVAGLGAPVADTVVESCGYTHRTVVSPLKRNPRCPVDHVPWTARPAPGPLGQATLRELAVAAGVRDEELVGFLVGDTRYVEAGTCVNGHDWPVGRFVESRGADVFCGKCGEALHTQPVFAHRVVPAPVLEHRLDLPLARLGAESPAWVVVREDDRAVMFEEV